MNRDVKETSCVDTNAVTDPDAGVCDLDRAASRIRGWKTCVTPIARGPLGGEIREAVRPSVRLARLVTDTAVALEAVPVAAEPGEFFHVAAISTPSVWQGLSVRPDFLMLEQGEVASSFVLPAGCELLVARLDRKRVASVWRSRAGADAEPSQRRTEVRAPSARELVELRALIRALLSCDALDEPECVASAEDDLHERVASMLQVPQLPHDLPPETRNRALRRAREYIEAHAAERFSLSTLCVESRCSERTLRTAFREHLGTTPMAFVKKLRLEGLRRDLRDASSHATTVLDLALRWGFWHMGHLGRDYLSAFGETPSETLRGVRRLVRENRHIPGM